MRVARIVTLASSAGKYGGPFDTATRQSQLAKRAGFCVRMLSGVESGDEQISSSIPVESTLPVVRPIFPTKGFTAYFSFEMLKQMVKVIRESDVVHISMARELIPVVALVVAKLSGKHVIVQPHGMLTARSSQMHRIVDHVIGPMVRAANSVIALTNHEAKELQDLYKIPGDSITIMGNPIPLDLPSANGPHRNNNEAIFIARLHPRKRVKDFLASASVAQAAGWDDQYTILGPDGGELCDILQRVSDAPNIAYEGTLPGQEVAKRLGMSKVFVLTSENEPWGNVLATALALGIPVVVPRSAALSEIVDAYGAGLVYEDQDIHILASQIHNLLTDRLLHERCRENAFRLTNDKLSSVALTRQLTGLYEPQPEQKTTSISGIEQRDLGD